MPRIAKTTGKKKTGLETDVHALDGKITGTVKLPKELFATEVNKTLLAQAVRVYLSNQREGSASTKTRGEVEGSTRKIYKQKGTGHARHGGIRAPIFVGGGITFGPKPHSMHMDFPKKMKRAALASALTSQFNEGNILVVDVGAMEPKTKLMAGLVKTLAPGARTLFVVGKDNDNVIRATRNIGLVDILPADSINTYAVLAHKKVMIAKDALKTLEETFLKKTV